MSQNRVKNNKTQQNEPFPKPLPYLFIFSPKKFYIFLFIQITRLFLNSFMKKILQILFIFSHKLTLLPP